MFLNDDYFEDHTPLKIPDLDLFSSFKFPPMSPQVSAEVLFARKEKKEEEWKKCKKISGGMLSGPCSCDECEASRSSSSSFSPSPRWFDEISYRVPRYRDDLVVEKKYFDHPVNPEDFLTPADIFPKRNHYDDDDEYDEVLIPVRRRRRRRPKIRRHLKRRRDDDEYYVEDDLDLAEDERLAFPCKSKKKPKKSHIPSGRIKYLQEAKGRSFSIMSLYEKGNRSRSETGYLGVRISTSGRRFRATVNYLGKPRNVGTFDTPEEAAMEYDKKLLELSGWQIDRNRLNFCDRWDFVARKLLPCLSRRPEKRIVNHDFDSLFD